MKESVGVLLFTTVTAPVVFTVRDGVLVLMLPMFPEVELSEMDILPVSSPAAVCVMAPEPFAVKVTIPAAEIALPPSAMLPLLRLDVSDKVPFALMFVAIVTVLLADTDKLLNVAPPDENVSALNPPFVIVALPVVFAVTLGVSVEEVKLPFADDRDTDVVAFISPLPDNVPKPEALSTMVLAVRRLLPKVMSLLPAVVAINRAEFEVREFERVTLLLFKRVKLVKGATDVERLSAPELVTLTVPVVFSDRWVVAVFMGFISPVLEVKLTDVLPEMMPVDELIAPEPLAEIITAAPLRLLAPSDMLPLAAVVVRVIGPDVRELVSVMLALSDTFKLVNVTTGDDRLVRVPVLVTVA